VTETLTLISHIRIQVTSTAAGHFTADILRFRADLAASSACSLPLIPISLEIQIKITVFGEFDNWLYSVINFYT